MIITVKQDSKRITKYSVKNSVMGKNTNTLQNLFTTVKGFYGIIHNKQN
jgi:hypothetical protein